MLSAAWKILAKDLRQRVRDKSLFILGLGVPLGLAAVFSIVFGSALDGDIDVTVGVVDEADNAATGAFVAAVTAIDEGIEVVALDDRESAAITLTDGEVDAVLVLPANAGLDPSIAPHVHADRTIAAEIAAALGGSFAGAVAATAQAVQAASTLEGSTVDLVELATAVGASEPAWTLENATADTRQLDPTTYIAAGMAVMFLFFSVGFGVMGWLEEQRDGTLARLQAAPIPRAAIAVGKGMTSLVVGLLTMAVLVTSTQLLLGASWGPPLGVAVLVVAGVVAATGIVAAITAVANRMEQAESIQAIVAVGLGMLGGAFFPLGDGTGILGLLSRLTPHFWFLEGLAAIQGDASWTAALPASGALLAFAVAAAWVGIVLTRWRRA